MVKLNSEYVNPEEKVLKKFLKELFRLSLTPSCMGKQCQTPHNCMGKQFHQIPAKVFGGHFSGTLLRSVGGTTPKSPVLGFTREKNRLPSFLEFFTDLLPTWPLSFSHFRTGKQSETVRKFQFRFLPELALLPFFVIFPFFSKKKSRFV